MKYEIWRIVGNAFPPMYSAKQIEESIKFILENEEWFPDLKKTWLLNRIADPDQCNRLHSLLEEAGQEVLISYFDEEEFRELSTDAERYQYLTNVNRARNQAITAGLSEADVVIPVSFDTMIRHDGWGQFVWHTKMEPDDRYYAFGVWHGTDTEEVLGTKPPIVREDFILGDQRVLGLTEPKVAFTKNSDLRFNETVPYGEFDNVELLWRLGIMGCWDRGKDPLRVAAMKDPSIAYGQTPISSWLYKLPSMGKNNVDRAKLKEEGRIQLLRAAKHLTGI